MQTATETTTAGFADLICSDAELLEAEFAALVARTGLEPPTRAGCSGPGTAVPGEQPETLPRVARRAPDARIRAVARYPPVAGPRLQRPSHDAVPIQQ